MKRIAHKITHQFQPTNNTCGYASLAMFLSCYGKDYKAEDLVARVPQPTDEQGKSYGSVTSQLVDWCQTEGFQTHMYSSDLFVLDLSWKNLNSTQIKERLKEIRAKRKTPVMDDHWTRVYIDAYISMLNHGSELSVVSFITSDLLYKLLGNGPVFANICSTASRGNGRSISHGLRETTYDDLNGRINTHSIVIYGRDEDGNFLVADPWDGLTTYTPEHMVLSIEAAQVECDNQVFVITKSSKTN